ncbi:MAG: AtpZ/AtpI family protein [Candidatus Roizmanbacteria bacterium]|nr:AtpZ/AtpI family protein [Candidatus Roizmanbacteria bacterium]
MVQYSRSHLKKVNSSFVIESFKKKEKKQTKETFQMSDVLDLGMYLVVPLLCFLGVGIVLDNKLKIQPFGTIFGILFGTIGSLFNLIKIVRRFSTHA